MSDESEVAWLRRRVEELEGMLVARDTPTATGPLPPAAPSLFPEPVQRAIKQRADPNTPAYAQLVREAERLLRENLTDDDVAKLILEGESPDV